MKNALKLALMLTATIGLLAICACDDDDGDGGGTTIPPTAEAWEGVWLSTGADVAPVLATGFNVDTVRVTMNDDNTIVLETHFIGATWTVEPGVYTITKSANSDIDVIDIVYSNLEQDGIVQVFTGTPDYMWLEVVATVPDYGLLVPTVSEGFAANPDYTDPNFNLQVYRKVN